MIQEEAIELTDEQEYQLGLFRSFSALGLDEQDALQLAEANASPSAARSLLRKGCSPKLVAKILA